MSTWHYMKNGVQTGPVTTEELTALLASGAIASDTMVWRQGLAGWVAAATLPEFSALARPTAPAAAAAAPAKSGNRTIIIILCVLGALLLLIGGCVTTCTYIAAKKAKEYSRQAEKNPAFASLSLIASIHPDVEIVTKDEASGKITVRNKKTGETVTINTNDYSAANIGESLEKLTREAKAAAQKAESAAKEMPDNSNEPAKSEATPSPAEEPVSVSDAAAQKIALAKMPACLPAYPGATTSHASFDQMVGGITAGNYIGVTHDKPADIAEFYEKKLLAAGYTSVGKVSEPSGNGPSTTLVMSAGNPSRTVTIMAGTEEDGRVQVEINYIQNGN